MEKILKKKNGEKSTQPTWSEQRPVSGFYI